MMIQLPDFNERFSGLKLFVGGCVERGIGSSFRRQGHAHTSPDDPHHGWICIRKAARVFACKGSISTGFSLSGEPGKLLLHEWAHILAGDKHGHDAVWMRHLADIGGKLQAFEKQRFAKAYKQYRKAANSPSMAR